MMYCMTLSLHRIRAFRGRKRHCPSRQARKPKVQSCQNVRRVLCPPLLLPYKYYKEGNKDKAVEMIKEIGLEILEK